MHRSPRSRRIAIIAALSALLSPAALSQDDRPERRVADPKLQSAINEAIYEACAYLREAQQDDGRWSYDGRGGPFEVEGPEEYSVGLSALALYALAASGTRADDPAVVKGLSWVHEHKKHLVEGAYANYCGSLMILALTRIDPKEHQRWIKELSAALVRSQLDHGQWTYPWRGRYEKDFPPQGDFPRTFGDNSNTQFSVLALWSSKVLAGYGTPKKVWSKSLDYFEEAQNDDLGWPYRTPQIGGDTMSPPGGGRRGPPGGGRGARPGSDKDLTTPVMTAACLSSWVYARSAYRGGLGKLEDTREEKFATRALAAFLAGKDDWDWEDPYFLYTLERVATAFDLPVDRWYEEGARGLVAAQRRDGRWGSRFRRTPGDQRNVYETSFSLLFLSRATSYAVTGGK